MNSREKILSAVRNSQPEPTALPDISGFAGQRTADTAVFKNVLQAIGATVYLVSDEAAVAQLLATEKASHPGRYITTLSALSGIAEMAWTKDDPHTLHDVSLAIIRAQFGVCENGAVWVSEQEMVQRAVPFIAENLAVVVEEKTLVATMHEAYQLIGQAAYGFGTFIAGPSKTADIEQSLVLGAHGPKNMLVFVLSDTVQ